MSIFILSKILLLILILANNFQNKIKRLYNKSPIAYYTNCIF